MTVTPVVKVLREGDAASAFPVTIAIVSNPVLESDAGSGILIEDPGATSEAAFDAAALRACDCLSGRLAGQREVLLDDPRLSSKIRVVSVYFPGCPVEVEYCLVTEDLGQGVLVARRNQIASRMLEVAPAIDYVLALTGSTTLTRSSAWPTSDDQARGGVGFRMDGLEFMHCFWPRVPGCAAVHVSETGLTVLHEFQHVVGSYENGQILDLYVDRSGGVNKRVGRPIPPAFGSLGTRDFASDPVRDGLAYPDGWSTFHCELIDASRPALMDNYRVPGLELECQNDAITRDFVIGRLVAKSSR